MLARAERLVAAAAALTAEPLPPARALAEGNAHLNAALLAALFRACPALDALAAAGERAQLAAWLEDYSLEARTLVCSTLVCCYLCLPVTLVGYACIWDWTCCERMQLAAWLEEYSRRRARSRLGTWLCRPMFS